MASAVLAGRSELYWGESKVHMSKPPLPFNRRFLPSSTNPNTNPNPTTSTSGDPGDYVTYNTASYTRRELRDLQSRLAGELTQVRNLLGRIESYQSSSQTTQFPRQTPQKRHAPGPPPPPPQLQAAVMKKCGQILTKLQKHKSCVWFNAPVDVAGMGLHDYHTIITNPMDLGTVKSKLASRKYRSHAEFAADVRLTFHNALRYNPVGHEVHTVATQLLALFESDYRHICDSFEHETTQIIRSPPPPPAPAVAPPPVRAVAHQKLPKPKARDPNKRPMTYEEKRKLSDGLQELPDEKMLQVVQIVRKRVGDPEMVGDEIELDMEAMDVETLWELDRFNTNYKKSVSKLRRLDNAGNAVAAAAAHNVGSADTVAVDSAAVVEIGDLENEMLEKSRGGEPQVEEYVDIGDEMPSASYPAVEIEKDAGVAASSLSSSSGQSSSSSGSDSGSSTDSDSDGDEVRSPA